MYFRSRCASAEMAPYSAPVTPSVISTGAQNCAPSGNSVIATRRIPKAPSFIRTPACSMDTAVGAATWPSGDQVWKGHRPARIPNPSANNGKTAFWKFSSYAIELRLLSPMRSNVPRSASTNVAKMPTKISALPPTRYSTSFIAPYSFVRVNVPKSLLAPHTAISRYIGSTASS